MSRESDFAAALEALEQRLRRGPLSAAAVAEWAGCSKPTAYHRIRELSKRASVYEMRVRRSKTGPLTRCYGVR